MKTLLTLFHFFIINILLCSACSGSDSNEETPNIQNVWKLTEFTINGADKIVISEDSKDNYTIEFKTNGTAIIKSVLNRYSSHYSIVENAIKINDINGSKILETDTYNDIYIDYLLKASSFAIIDNSLTINTVDGQYLKFRLNE